MEKSLEKVFYQVANKADGCAHSDPFPGVHTAIHQHANKRILQILRQNNVVTLEWGLPQLLDRCSPSRLLGPRGSTPAWSGCWCWGWGWWWWWVWSWREVDRIPFLNQVWCSTFCIVNAAADVLGCEWRGKWGGVKLCLPVPLEQPPGASLPGPWGTPVSQSLRPSLLI